MFIIVKCIIEFDISNTFVFTTQKRLHIKM